MKNEPKRKPKKKLLVAISTSQRVLDFYRSLPDGERSKTFTEILEDGISALEIRGQEEGENA